MFKVLLKRSRKGVVALISIFVAYFVLQELELPISVYPYTPISKTQDMNLTDPNSFMNALHPPHQPTLITIKNPAKVSDSILGNYDQNTWFETISLEMARRQKILHSYCQKLKTKQELFKSKMASLSISDSVHKLFFCPIPKIGLNTWFRIFYALSNVDSSRKKSVMASTKGLKSFQKQVRRQFSTHREAWEQMNDGNTYKFTFVRHPIQRLVSGYRDKIESCSYSAMLCEWLEESYGDNSFGSFLQYLLSRHRDPCQLDIHFRPIYCNCQHCTTVYHAIGHLETFADDAKYILVQTNLSHLISKPLLTTAYNSAGSKHNLSSKSALEYMEEVPPGIKLRVFDMYKHDFELFGYSKQDY